MELRDVLQAAGVKLDTPRSLTYAEYCAAMDVAVPHSADEPCSCEGCGACKGKIYGCTCDIDWELAREIRELWYD